MSSQPIFELAQVTYLDKEVSKAIILSMSRRGMKFSDRLEKKIKKWKKRVDKSKPS